jgi:hypothetical protein
MKFRRKWKAIEDAGCDLPATQFGWQQLLLEKEGEDVCLGVQARDDVDYFFPTTQHQEPGMYDRHLHAPPI